MKLSSYLNTKYILNDFEVTDINDAIIKSVDYIVKKDKRLEEFAEEIKNSALERENEISTAIGRGVALPHARLKNFNDLIVIIIQPKNPIQMTKASSTEVTKVELIVFIIADTLRNKNILKAMSAFSKIATKNPELLEKLKTSDSPAEIIKLIDNSNIVLEENLTATDFLRTDVETITPNTTLKEVAKRFILEKTSSFPVVTCDNKFLGEISETEFLSFGMPTDVSTLEDLNFVTKGEPFEDYISKGEPVLVEKIYNPKVRVIDPQTPILEISFLMIKNNISRLYVVEDGIYLGTVKRSDIIKRILHI